VTTLIDRWSQSVPQSRWQGSRLARYLILTHERPPLPIRRFGHCMFVDENTNLRVHTKWWPFSEDRQWGLSKATRYKTKRRPGRKIFAAMKIKGSDQRVSQKSCDRIKERINIYNKKAWDVFSRISLPIEFGTNLYLSISEFSCQLSWLFWTKLCGKNMCLKSFTLC